MKFNFKPKVTKDREATKEELECIEKTEEMLDNERKLPPASQMVRDLAVTHWKTLGAWLRGSQTITTQEEAERRWEICKHVAKMKFSGRPESWRKYVIFPTTPQEKQKIGGWGVLNREIARSCVRRRGLVA